MKFICLILCLIVLSTKAVFATETLIISDIDDTLKISHVKDPFAMVANAVGSGYPFIGMSELLNILKNQQTEFVYLSSAPTWLMYGKHKDFLESQNFPKGQLVLRLNEESSTYKLNKIRSILKKMKPKTLYLIGDDGELDAAVYERIIKENQDIKIFAWIHNIYSESSFSFQYSENLRPYATPVEIASDLLNLSVISKEQFQKLSLFVVNSMQSDYVQEGSGPQVIPTWAICSYARSFSRPQMNQKLLKRVTNPCSIE